MKRESVMRKNSDEKLLITLFWEVAKQSVLQSYTFRVVDMQLKCKCSLIEE